MLARGAFDVFDNLLARALRCLSLIPFLSDCDAPETLSYQGTLLGPKGADVRQRYVDWAAVTRVAQVKAI
jgi:hypothetical protein